MPPGAPRTPMLPWGHAALGYLLYHLLLRADDPDRRPTGAATLAVGVGTQFPDLIDKPGAWTLGVVPAGRSVAHSAVVLVPLLALSWLLVSPERRGAVAAFAVGVGSHLLGDSWTSLVRLRPDEVSFLLWPLYPVEPEHGLSFVEFLLSLTLTPELAVGLVVTGLAAVVWYRDGRPGLALLFSWADGAAVAVTGR